MNRRTFLKLTAIATIGLPTLAQAGKKQQWIPLKEQFPKKGQQIVMLDHWERMRTCIRVGSVKSIHPSLKYSEYLGKFMMLDTDFALWCYKYKGSQYGCCELILNRNSANYSAREILNTPWINSTLPTSGSFAEFPMGPVPFYSKTDKMQLQCWIPAPDRIPQILPPFPSNELKQSSGYTLPDNRGRWFEYLFPEKQNG